MNIFDKINSWRFVIHGGMDGFSRSIVYLKLANNNRAKTVLDGFIDGVTKFGCPSRVRSDKGGENVLCCDYMLARRGYGRRTWIAGKSTHNQRIERFWRDLYDGTIRGFYEMFT